MTHRWIASIVMALLLPATPLAGQPVPGHRIRIGFTHGGEVTGIFSEWTPTAVVIHQGGIPIAVPRTRIGVLERSLGVRGDFGRNFLISVAAGALILGGAAALATDPSEPCDMFCGRQASFMLGAIGGGVIGIPIGLITGAASYQERWERVPVPPASDVTFELRPSAGGGVDLSLRVPIGSSDAPFP
jgi:hypothetical protein